MDVIRHYDPADLYFLCYLTKNKDGFPLFSSCMAVVLLLGAVFFVSTELKDPSSRPKPVILNNKEVSIYGHRCCQVDLKNYLLVKQSPPFGIQLN